MLRKLVAVAALLALPACQQGGTASVNEAAKPSASAAAPRADAVAPGTAPLPRPGEASIAVPPSYDWSFATHGGSGDLVFGDGDRAEGVSLLTLSCLPGTNAVTAADAGPGAGLRSGQVTVTLRQDGEIAVGHPVLRDLLASGSVTLVSGGEARTLAAKPGAGRVAIESFLAYCSPG